MKDREKCWKNLRQGEGSAEGHSRGMAKGTCWQVTFIWRKWSFANDVWDRRGSRRRASHTRVSGERQGSFLLTLEEITWHIGYGAFMSTMGSKGWRSLGYCRLLGQDCSAALAFHVFGEQQFLAPLKMEHQGEGWWGGRPSSIRDGFISNASAGPQGVPRVWSGWYLSLGQYHNKLALALLVCSSWAALGDALIQEELRLKKDWGHLGGEMSPCPIPESPGF